MNSIDLIVMGIKNLLRRKVRSILAVTGVIIGACAITIMVSLGIGLSASFENQIKSYGNLHIIDVSSNSGGNATYSPDTTKNKKQAVLNDKTIDKIAKIEGITAITPVESAYMKVGIGRNIASVSIKGVKPEVFEKFGYKLAEGRNLSLNDKNAIVFGKNVPTWFYIPNQPSSSTETAPINIISGRIKLTSDMNYGERKTAESSEKKIDYPIYDAQGVGLLSNENDDTSYNAYMNIATVKKMNQDTIKAQNMNSSQKKEYSEAKVYVEDVEQVKDISKQIKEMGLQSSSLTDMLDQMKKTSAMIQAVLGGIGAVSMLVAALGITNTMIMSIYERTKEIGVMKVIGANIKDIKKLFLFEAAAIGFIGGTVGVSMSYIFSTILNTFLGSMFGASMGMAEGSSNMISIIPMWLALATLMFTTFVGVAAGYFPAKRAMQLSALESLRND